MEYTLTCESYTLYSGSESMHAVILLPVQSRSQSEYS